VYNFFTQIENHAEGEKKKKKLLFQVKRGKNKKLKTKKIRNGELSPRFTQPTKIIWASHNLTQNQIKTNKSLQQFPQLVSPVAIKPLINTYTNTHTKENILKKKKKKKGQSEGIISLRQQKDLIIRNLIPYQRVVQTKKITRKFCGSLALVETAVFRRCIAGIPWWEGMKKPAGVAEATDVGPRLENVRSKESFNLGRKPVSSGDAKGALGFCVYGEGEEKWRRRDAEEEKRGYYYYYYY
jgi:hypothetical protein